MHAVGTFCTPTKTQPASSCTLLAEDLVYSLYAQGLIFYRVAASDAALADGPSTLGAFTFVMLISYLLPFAAIPIFVYDKQFYLRESGLGLYATWVYTISQACAHHRHHSRHITASPPNSITRRHTRSISSSDTFTRQLAVRRKLSHTRPPCPRLAPAAGDS